MWDQCWQAWTTWKYSRNLHKWWICSQWMFKDLEKSANQEIISSSVTVLTRLANMSAGVNTMNTICTHQNKRYSFRNDFKKTYEKRTNTFWYQGYLQTLFNDFRASAGRRLQYPVPIKAPKVLMISTSMIGINATSKNDKNPIPTYSLQNNGSL